MKLGHFKYFLVFKKYTDSFTLSPPNCSDSQVAFCIYQLLQLCMRLCKDILHLKFCNIKGNDKGWKQTRGSTRPAYNACRAPTEQLASLSHRSFPLQHLPYPSIYPGNRTHYIKRGGACLRDLMLHFSQMLTRV